VTPTAALVEELTRLRTHLRRIERLHHPRIAVSRRDRREGEVCAECLLAYPCATVQNVTAALDSEQGKPENAAAEGSAPRLTAAAPRLNARRGA
jgi:hypothetical protein